MAYTTISKFEEGDNFTHTDYNAIRSNLIDLHDKHPGVMRNHAASVSHDHGFWSSVFQDSEQTFTHTFRYLAYKSTGAIRDITGLADDVSLSDTGDINFFDLDTVGWLAYGMTYIVTGVTHCIEVDFP